MKNEELNKYMAEFMGWVTGESIGYAPAWYFKKSANNIYETVIPISNWNPTEDRNQMAMCEDRIPEDKYKKYCLTLIDILGIERQSYADECLHYYKALFKFATPNTRQRAEALYKTMEG
jgi:hypothetical protein